MYLLHLIVIRKELFYQAGGFRDEFSGAQDYDLALRATAQARHIHHIPKILYHWRKLAGSAAAEVDAKPQALDAGFRALQDFVTAQKIDATGRARQAAGSFSSAPCAARQSPRDPVHPHARHLRGRRRPRPHQPGGALRQKHRRENGV